MTALEIVAAPAPAWVQDAGRPGHMVDGVPPGGAWVPERLVVANRAVGNPGTFAAIETFGGLVVAARGGDLRISWEGAAAWLPRDHVRVLSPGSAACGYLAVAGGIDVPLVLGGRGLLAAAGLGGGVGRPLRAGDRLDVGPGPVEEEIVLPDPGWWGEGAPIRVVRGPDPGRFAPEAWPAFLAGPWRSSPSFDRVGARLSGPLLRRADGHPSQEDGALSAPMVRGAIQVPGGGAPIVLGPDHPTTGGYPLIAVVARADLGALALRGPGAPLHFVEVSVAEARDASARWGAEWGADRG